MFIFILVFALEILCFSLSVSATNCPVDWERMYQLDFSEIDSDRPCYIFPSVIYLDGFGSGCPLGELVVCKPFKNKHCAYVRVKTKWCSIVGDSKCHRQLTWDLVEAKPASACKTLYDEVQYENCEVWECDNNVRPICSIDEWRLTNLDGMAGTGDIRCTRYEPTYLHYVANCQRPAWIFSCYGCMYSHKVHQRGSCKLEGKRCVKELRFKLLSDASIPRCNEYKTILEPCGVDDCKDQKDCTDIYQTAWTVASIKYSAACTQFRLSTRKVKVAGCDTKIHAYTSKSSSECGTYKCLADSETIYYRAPGSGTCLKKTFLTNRSFANDTDTNATPCFQSQPGNGQAVNPSSTAALFCEPRCIYDMAHPAIVYGCKRDLPAQRSGLCYRTITIKPKGVGTISANDCKDQLVKEECNKDECEIGCVYNLDRLKDEGSCRLEITGDRVSCFKVTTYAAVGIGTISDTNCTEKEVKVACTSSDAGCRIGCKFQKEQIVYGIMKDDYFSFSPRKPIQFIESGASCFAQNISYHNYTVNQAKLITAFHAECQWTPWTKITNCTRDQNTAESVCSKIMVRFPLKRGLGLNGFKCVKPEIKITPCNTTSERTCDLNSEQRDIVEQNRRICAKDFDMKKHDFCAKTCSNGSTLSNSSKLLVYSNKECYSYTDYIYVSSSSCPRVACADDCIFQEDKPLDLIYESRFQYKNELCGATRRILHYTHIVSYSTPGIDMVSMPCPVDRKYIQTKYMQEGNCFGSDERVKRQSGCDALWSAWSACSVPCNVGIRTRSKQIPHEGSCHMIGDAEPCMTRVCTDYIRNNNCIYLYFNTTNERTRILRCDRVKIAGDATCIDHPSDSNFAPSDIPITNNVGTHEESTDMVCATCPECGFFIFLLFTIVVAGFGFGITMRHSFGYTVDNGWMKTATDSPIDVEDLIAEIKRIDNPTPDRMQESENVAKVVSETMTSYDLESESGCSNKKDIEPKSKTICDTSPLSLRVSENSNQHKTTSSEGGGKTVSTYAPSDIPESRRKRIDPRAYDKHSIATTRSQTHTMSLEEEKLDIIAQAVFGIHRQNKNKETIEKYKEETETRKDATETRNQETKE